MSRVYVGNLPMDLQREDLEDIFKEYGKIREIDLKTPLRPPAFAFVAYEETRDAEDAVHFRDGYEFQGQRLRVEMARGAPGGGGDREARRGMDMSDKMTDYRVIVTGLPPSASWQDLKDHMRKAGDVVYTDVDHRGGGIVHYGNADDMEYALRKLNDSEFRNPFDSAPIRVVLPRDSYRGRGRSPLRRRRSHSRSYSRSCSRSRSRDRGRGGRGHDWDDRNEERRGGDRDHSSRHDDRRDRYDDERRDRGRRDDDNRRRD